jgi:hypothetical protein
MTTQSDPRLDVPCRRCRAAAGAKCRNYLGQGKFTCKERGTPAPVAVPEPVAVKPVGSVQLELFMIPARDQIPF